MHRSRNVKFFKTKHGDDGQVTMFSLTQLQNLHKGKGNALEQQFIDSLIFIWLPISQWQLPWKSWSGEHERAARNASCNECAEICRSANKLHNIANNYSASTRLEGAGILGYGNHDNKKTGYGHLEESKELSKRNTGCLTTYLIAKRLLGSGTKNNCICIATNYHATDTATACHYSQKERKRVNVPQPKVIQYYNTHLAGVSFLDGFISEHDIKVKKVVLVNAKQLAGNTWHGCLEALCGARNWAKAWPVTIFKRVVQGLMIKRVISRDRPTGIGAFSFHCRKKRRVTILCN